MKFLFALLVALVFNPFANAEAGKEVARPEDGAKLYVTAFGDVPDNVIKEVQAKYPNSHFKAIADNDPMAERYRPTVGQFPAIVVQQPSGKVIYKKSGLTGCRPCKPVEPTPPVAPPVLVEPIPDTVVPDTEPNYLAAGLLLVAGAGVGAGRRFYSELKGN